MICWHNWQLLVWISMTPKWLRQLIHVWYKEFFYLLIQGEAHSIPIFNCHSIECRGALHSLIIHLLLSSNGPKKHFCNWKKRTFSLETFLSTFEAKKWLLVFFKREWKESWFLQKCVSGFFILKTMKVVPEKSFRKKFSKKVSEKGFPLFERLFNRILSLKTFFKAFNFEIWICLV